MKHIFNKIVCCIFVLCFLSSNIILTSADGWHDELNNSIENNILNRENIYANYLQKNATKQSGKAQVNIHASSYSKISKTSVITVAGDLEGQKDVTVWGSSPSFAEWKFDVQSEGLYEIALVYYPLKQSQRMIETALKIDGEFPFSEATSISLKSAYMSKPICQDEHGNDYNSSQVEIQRWYNESLRGEDGIEDDPFLFYFTPGSHTLTLYLLQEVFALSDIKIIPKTQTKTYDEYKKEKDSITLNNNADFSKMIQAENYSEKSATSIIPSSNRNSAHNVPFSYKSLKLNVIGGESWSKSGQWLEWNIEVPSDGWYSLNLRYSQSYNKNMPVFRRLYVDNIVPFKEADCIEFPYLEGWGLYNIKTSSGNEAYIWLDGGKHTIRLEAIMGEIQEIVSSVNNVVYDLSNVYQKINMITGLSPDQYRDYNLESNVPGMIDTFKRSSDSLKRTRNKLKEISKGKGSSHGIMDVLVYQLDDMISSPSSIPMRLSTLSSNISSLSSAAEDIKSQAMDLDYIYITSANVRKPKVNDNAFQSIKRGFLIFIYSFIENYNTIASDNSSSIMVWINSGRDQAQVINRMVNDMFVPEYGIQVNFKLVTASLIQAFLSGNPPDAMIMTQRGQPVNLALRGALADLSKMPDFEKVKEQYQKGALEPYLFNDGCYGLPDSQSFFMMFYRKDILKSLNLSVPKTWDELYDVMQILHINNMDVGLPYAGIDAAGAVNGGLSNTSIFSALLLQHGGTFYTPDNKKTALTSTEATEAFIQWTNYYTHYGIPLSFSFYNRFRTGTMPLGIENYTTFNQIYVAAPEIRNLWAMTEIPGTKNKDGTISHAQAGAGTASVITSTSKNKDAAWKFLCWWTGSEAQTRYSTDIESILGMAARYPTANISAFNNIQWSRADFDSLSKQWSEVREIPEVPGSYYTVRDVDNAFRSVVLNGKNAKETLIQYSRNIDAEMSRKRGEFALDDQ